MVPQNDLAIAAEYGECAVCFEPLCISGASVMTDGTGRIATKTSESETLPKRTCRHFLCQQCAPEIVPKKCPVCRRDFVATFDVPDPLGDPARWFDIVDLDGDGAIEKAELVDALKGMFPVEPRALEEMIDQRWTGWDSDCDGKLSSSEFRFLLAPFLSSTLANLKIRINPDLPDLQEKPIEWFNMWDTDGSGSLDRPEIVRALIKTIPNFKCGDEEILLQTFAAIWPIIDPNNDGKITAEEFVSREGLYDTLRANYNFGR